MRVALVLGVLVGGVAFLGGGTSFAGAENSGGLGRVVAGSDFPCIPEWAWLDRGLPRESVAGAPLVVDYSVRGGTASIVEVRETIPRGWTVISPGWDRLGKDSDTYVAGGRRILEVVPPADLAEGVYSFSGRVTSWHFCNGEVTSSISGANGILIRAQPRSCPGDCDGDGAVWVDELVTVVSIALGTAALSVCPAADRDGDGSVTVAELTLAVEAAVNGCAGDHVGR